MPNNALPNGTVTFLFTDIEGSTALWERHGEAMRPVLAAHDAILHTAVVANHGLVVKTTGDGLHAVFASAGNGLQAAFHAQRELAAMDWSAIAPDSIRVRMGLHTGEAELRDGDYYGSHVNRAARLMSLGHGGQVLLSGISATLVRDALPTGLELRELGRHSLRGLARPEEVWQLVIDGLPDTFPPLKSVDLVIGNLPARLTTFIGRSREMALVRERLGETRLLTLIGPGGTGKTRLSLEVAAAMQPAYSHGVWWVELAPVTDPSLVPSTVAGLFGLPATPGLSVETMLIDYLREKKVLLILDNCEHLVDAVARLVATLLPQCPQITILASSREGLGVYGETTVHLPPLGLPGPEDQTAAGIVHADAVQLFVNRAKAVHGQFSLSDTNAPAVSQIVRRLDGIPLAIELAAARTAVFGPEQIAARLDDRFRILTGGSRTALPRQQTLRALIDWSYDLLSEDERTLMRRLSVFSGGWTLDAAEFVAGELDVYSLLPALVNKSLVVVAREHVDVWGESTATTDQRYTFLETIRQYARDRLVESGEVEITRDRHFDFVWHLATQLGPLITVPNAALLGSGQLLLERDNMAAAVEWGLERYPDRVIDLCWNMALFLSDQDPGGEGLRWIRAALDQLDRLPAPAPEAAARLEQVWAKGMTGQALLSLFLGNLLESQRIAEQAIDRLRTMEDSRFLLGVAHFVWAQAGLFTQDPRTGEFTAESIRLIRGLSNEELGAMPFLALVLLVEARYQHARGNERASLEALDESETLLETSGRYYLPSADYVRLGLLQARGVDEVTLRTELDQALERLRENRSYRVAAMLESDYAHSLRKSGQLEEAAEIYFRTIRQWQQLGHRAAVANVLECLSFIYHAWEQPERAVRLLGAAERLREDAGQAMLGSEQIVYDAEVAALRDLIPPQVFTALWLEGRRLSTDAAVSLSVDDLGVPMNARL